MKYRRLTNAELKQLEPDFVRFLASQSIPATDWEAMKTRGDSKVSKLLDAFSDLIFERVLSNVKYLEKRTKHEWHIYKVMDERLKLNGLRLSGNEEIDFRQSTDLDLKSLYLEYGGNLTLFTAEKSFQKEKNLEVFDLLEAGCLIQKNGEFFELLERIKTTTDQQD